MNDSYFSKLLSPELNWPGDLMYLEIELFIKQMENCRSDSAMFFNDDERLCVGAWSGFYVAPFMNLSKVKRCSLLENCSLTSTVVLILLELWSDTAIVLPVIRCVYGVFTWCHLTRNCCKWSLVYVQLWTGQFLNRFWFSRRESAFNSL